MNDWAETRGRIATEWQRQLSDATQKYGLTTARLVEEHDHLQDQGVFMVTVEGRRADGSKISLPLVYAESTWQGDA